MTLELWIILGVGVAFVIGFGATTVLLLGLHAEIRRLSRLAEAAQRVLVDNLRQALPSKPATVPAAPRAAPPPPPPPEPVAVDAPPPPEPVVEEITLPLVELAAATAEPNASPLTAGARTPVVEPLPEAAAGPAWNPDRRLLVTRLASRGRSAEQIAAALRIPQDEVEQFLEANQLVARRTSV